MLLQLRQHLLGEVAVVKSSANREVAHVVEVVVVAEQESFGGLVEVDPYLEGVVEAVAEEVELAWLVNGIL